jgi:mono/diheme cytochrome c family protein
MRQRLWAGLGLSLAAGISVAAAAPAGPTGKAPAVSEATLELYKVRCQACHMPDGNAPLEMMNLADTTWKHGSRHADVVKVISEGVPQTAMLPFKALLTPAEIADLATYVRSFDKTLKPGKGGGKPPAKLP